MARPTLLTDELQDRLVTMLRAGNVIHVACQAVGIDLRSYQRWMQRGRTNAKADARHREFRVHVERALAEAEARAVAQVARAAQEDWRAAAWWLERQFPDRWGRQLPRAADEAAAVPVEVEIDSVDELASRRVSRRRGAAE